MTGPLTTEFLNWDPTRLHECPWQQGLGRRAGSPDPAEPEEEGDHEREIDESET